MTSEDSNSAHGYGFQENVYDGLCELKRDGYLTQVVKDFRIGQPGYLNRKQYYSPFLIQFNDRTRWILFTTTSLRTDRIKGQQWDSDRIKDVDGMISKAYLVYPDNASSHEVRCFVAQRNKYQTGFEFSRIDDIIPLGVLITQIREKDDEFLMESMGKKKKQAGLGRTLDFSGRNFERAIAAILSSQVYLETLKRHKPNQEDTYKKFVQLVSGLAIDCSQVVRICATAEKDDIGLLPTGGSPKTDVIVTITFKDDSVQYRTLMCKRTSKSHVSVHQYKADAIADILDKGNERLRRLLRMFQDCPVQGKYPQVCQEELAAELKPHLLKFCRWVFGGHGGAGSELQKANYMVTFNPIKNKMAVHSIDDYIAVALLDRNGFAGTPFQWTYASKREGKDIQLKMPVILD